ncbi:hypothetical protein [Brachyspira pilosicoli]|uniref:hypothetical protein n=1 Tax=Brachyspira pilosicoli TaxID=52584 RepID=UPI0030065F94
MTKDKILLIKYIFLIDKFLLEIINLLGAWSLELGAWSLELGACKEYLNYTCKTLYINII